MAESVTRDRIGRRHHPLSHRIVEDSTMNTALVYGPALALGRPLSLVTLILFWTILACSPAIAAHEDPVTGTLASTDSISANLTATAHLQASPSQHSLQVDFAPDSGVVSVKTFIDPS